MKRFNKRQKNILVAALLIIGVSFIIWFAYGMEIFTKTQVLVEIKDDVFDTSYKEWHNKFIWGLDLTLAISGLTAFISGIFLFFFRNKNQLKQNT